MNLTCHIVKKDLRRLQVPLALWALLLVAQILIGVRLFQGDGDNLEWFGRMALYGQLFFALDLLVSYVLVATLIHDDPLVGSRVFWLTRPISGGRLLGAKVLGIALMFGVLPVLVWLPWWLACGYGWHDIAAAVFETLIWKMMVVAPALLLAVLTDHFSRFLVWTLGLMLLLVLMGSLINGSHHVLGGSITGVEETRTWMTLLTAGVGIVMLVGHQFLTRHLPRSLAIGGVGFALVMLIGVWWPWDWSRLVPDRPVPPTAITDKISIALDHVSLPSAHWDDPRMTEAEAIVTLRLTARGMPDDLGMMTYWPHSFIRSEHTVSWGDGTILRQSGYVGFGWFNDWIDGAARRLLRLPDLQPDSKGNELSLANQRKLREARPLTTWMVLPSPLAARMAKDPPSYLGNLNMALVRPEVEFEHPLRESERLRHRTNTLRIARAEVRADGRMFVNLIESRPDPRTDSASYALSGRFNIPDAQIYALINRDRMEAELIPGYGATQEANIGTVKIRWNTLSFAAPLKQRDGQWVRELPTWFEGTTLARVGLVEETRLSREVKVERFEATP